MLVMKFGGASVRNAGAVRNVGRIIREFEGIPILVVVSAMGKTTSHLDGLARTAMGLDESQAREKFEVIRSFHFEIVNELFPEGNPILQDKLSGFFNEIDRIIQGLILLGEFPSRTYDRIVSYGELISSAILQAYLDDAGISACFLDVREIIKTDATYSHARVIWSQTDENIRKNVKPLFNNHSIVVTQGFIATTMEGKVTTLGREGSDFTAAIFANCLDADKMIVWKDVKGVLNADPRLNPDAIKHEKISYEEAVEMTFYGASVLHPKTIKPLYNKGIPLEVKCFNDITEEGTLVSKAGADLVDASLSPSVLTSTIVKPDQVILRISSKDLSFMKTTVISEVFRFISRSDARVNLVQTSAIILSLVLDNVAGPIGELTSLLLDEYEVETEEGLTLTTYLNFTDRELSYAKDAILVQQGDGRLFVVKKEN